MAVWILSRIGNKGDKYSLFGDMEEEYCKIIRENGYREARFWYWYQVLICIPPFLRNSLYWSLQMFKNYIYEDIHDKSAGCPPAVGPTLKKEFPEVLEFARLYGTSYMNNIVTYIPSSDSVQSSIPPDDKIVTFNQEKIFYADASFLKMFSTLEMKIPWGKLLLLRMIMENSFIRLLEYSKISQKILMSNSNSSYPIKPLLI